MEFDKETVKRLKAERGPSIVSAFVYIDGYEGLKVSGESVGLYQTGLFVDKLGPGVKIFIPKENLLGASMNQTSATAYRIHIRTDLPNSPEVILRFDKPKKAVEYYAKLREFIGQTLDEAENSKIVATLEKNIDDKKEEDRQKRLQREEERANKKAAENERQIQREAERVSKRAEENLKRLQREQERANKRAAENERQIQREAERVERQDVKCSVSNAMYCPLCQRYVEPKWSKFSWVIFIILCFTIFGGPLYLFWYLFFTRKGTCPICGCTHLQKKKK